MQEHPRLKKTVPGHCDPGNHGPLRLGCLSHVSRVSGPLNATRSPKGSRNWHCAAAIDLECYPAAIRPEPKHVPASRSAQVLEGGIRGGVGTVWGRCGDGVVTVW